MTECINDACTQACTTECRAVIAAAYERLREASGHPVPAPAPQLRDEIAAAINYALLPVMPRAEYRAHAASHAADAVLAVPAIQQLAETRDALRMAEGDRDAAQREEQQLREEVARLKTEADDSDEAARRALAQRQEMAAERYAWQERGDRAEAALERVRAIPRLPHASQQTGELGRAYTRGWESVINAIDTAVGRPQEQPCRRCGCTDSRNCTHCNCCDVPDPQEQP